MLSQPACEWEVVDLLKGSVPHLINEIQQILNHPAKPTLTMYI